MPARRVGLATVVLGASVALALAGCGAPLPTQEPGGPAGAEGHDSPSQATSTPTPTTIGGSAPDRELDAKVIDYMAAMGVDEAEAIRRVRSLEEAHPVIDALRVEVGDTLAGLWIEHEPDLSIHIRLTADPSPDLASIIDASPVPVIVHDGAAITGTEARRRLQAALPSLLDAIPWLQGTYVDERTGEAVLDIFVDGTEEEVADAKGRIEDAVAAFTRETQLPVRIEYMNGPVTMQALMKGELVVEGRCAYIALPDQSRTLLVFSSGVVSWEEGAVLLRNRTERFETGDRVSVGGGEGTFRGKSRINGEPDDSCDTEREVFMTSTYSVTLAGGE